MAFLSNKNENRLFHGTEFLNAINIKKMKKKLHKNKNMDVWSVEHDEHDDSTKELIKGN